MAFHPRAPAPSKVAWRTRPLRAAYGQQEKEKAKKIKN